MIVSNLAQDSDIEKARQLGAKEYFVKVKISIDDLIGKIEAFSDNNHHDLRRNFKKIQPGAKVKVYEGKTPFEGLVIARKHGSEPGATFTVRAIVAGVGVEKVYPVHSPAIVKVEIVSSPKKVHRSKLYFVRKFPERRSVGNWTYRCNDF